jgi:hypothetical protein
LVRICDLQARRVAAELLKTGIADGHGSPRTIKLEFHSLLRRLFHRLRCDEEAR